MLTIGKKARTTEAAVTSTMMMTTMNKKHWKTQRGTKGGWQPPLPCPCPCTPLPIPFFRFGRTRIWSRRGEAGGAVFPTHWEAMDAGNGCLGTVLLHPHFLET
jgi:hypothetical protein